MKRNGVENSLTSLCYRIWAVSEPAQTPITVKDAEDHVIPGSSLLRAVHSIRQESSVGRKTNAKVEQERSLKTRNEGPTVVQTLSADDDLLTLEQFTRLSKDITPTTCDAVDSGRGKDHNLSFWPVWLHLDPKYILQFCIFLHFPELPPSVWIQSDYIASKEKLNIHTPRLESTKYLGDGIGQHLILYMKLMIHAASLGSIYILPIRLSISEF